MQGRVEQLNSLQKRESGAESSRKIEYIQSQWTEPSGPSLTWKNQTPLVFEYVKNLNLYLNHSSVDENSVVVLEVYDILADILGSPSTYSDVLQPGDCDFLGEVHISHTSSKNKKPVDYWTVQSSSRPLGFVRVDVSFNVGLRFKCTNRPRKR